MKNYTILFIAFLTFDIQAGCQPVKQQYNGAVDQTKLEPVEVPLENGLAKAYFASGCFWCVEAVFEELDGVTSVESGYAGGAVENPSYEAVCTGTTGHAEVCQIRYDAKKISFDELLDVFFSTHDPTTLNQQGADRGTQYRSVVFYHERSQKEATEKYIAQLDKEKVWDSPVVTEITELPNYFPAEDYHQNYFKEHPFQGYCRVVINPKVKKFRKQFRDKLKDSK